MSMKEKIKNFFYLEEDDEVEVQAQPKTTAVQQKEQQVVKSPVKPHQKRERKNDGETFPNVVSLQAVNSMKNSKLVIVEPRVYAEAQDISEHLKNKRAIIVNLQRIDRDQGVRIIDFLSGTVYALGGDIQRIGVDIFLCTPDNVEVTGEVSDYLYDEI